MQQFVMECKWNEHLIWCANDYVCVRIESQVDRLNVFANIRYFATYIILYIDINSACAQTADKPKHTSEGSAVCAVAFVKVATRTVIHTKHELDIAWKFTCIDEHWHVSVCIVYMIIYVTCHRFCFVRYGLYVVATSHEHTGKNGMWRRDIKWLVAKICMYVYVYLATMCDSKYFCIVVFFHLILFYQQTNWADSYRLSR